MYQLSGYLLPVGWQDVYKRQYHTLNSIEFMLANGHWYNSGSVEDRTRFEETERELCQGLTEIRREILNKEVLRNRIVEKYKIKNVTGYSVNAFVDFEHPMDIFAHLLIGAEGTLGFIVSAELNTLPLLPVYSSAMLYFENAKMCIRDRKCSAKRWFWRLEILIG